MIRFILVRILRKLLFGICFFFLDADEVRKFGVLVLMDRSHLLEVPRKHFLGLRAPLHDHQTEATVLHQLSFADADDFFSRCHLGIEVVDDTAVSFLLLFERLAEDLVLLTVPRVHHCGDGVVDDCGVTRFLLRRVQVGLWCNGTLSQSTG